MKEDTQKFWDGMAQALGYPTEKDMYEELFLAKGWSLERIATVLGYSRIAVRNRLILYRDPTGKPLFPMRRRGGPNNLGLTRRILDRFDKDWVMNAPVEDVCFKAKVTQSTVYQFRKRERLLTEGGDMLEKMGEEDDVLSTGEEPGNQMGDNKPDLGVGKVQ